MEVGGTNFKTRMFKTYICFRQETKDDRAKIFRYSAVLATLPIIRYFSINIGTKRSLFYGS